MTYVNKERRIKMPGRDGRGPIGMGPMTGRGFGLCSHSYHGRRNCLGRGFGPGYGARFGFGYGPGYFMQDVTEKEFLKKQKEYLESQIRLLEKELEDLKDD
jgi:hypothetical protein